MSTLSFEGFIRLLQALPETKSQLYMTPVPHLKVSWQVGGCAGGSCYSEACGGPVTPDTRVELTSLPYVVDLLYPECTMWQFVALRDALLTDCEREDCGYYGSCRVYLDTSVDLRRLYDWAVTKGWIPVPGE